MKIKFPIRVRLTIWYSILLVVTILAFATFAYFWESNELYSNLDNSLLNVANTLDNLITDSANNLDENQNSDYWERNFINKNDRFSLFRKEEQTRFVGPLRPKKNNSIIKSNDIVWAAIFKHILLNPLNYYIQISDSSKNIIWKSKTLIDYDLPIDKSYVKLVAPKNRSQNYFFDNIKIENSKLRLLIKQSKTDIISIAYSVEDVEATLRSLFSVLLLALPVILLLAVGGGLMLSTLSLKPVDAITKTTNKITATNLKLRLSDPGTNDELSRLTTTLNKMIERLDKSFTQIKQFTSDASHELRTPLTIMRGELEIALSKERSEEEYLEVIASTLDEVLRLSKVVEALLELSRADTGQTKMQLKKENISSIVTDLVEDFEIIADTKNIRIQSDIQNNVIANIDSVRLPQVIINIIDNAVKYSLKDSLIKVSLYDREHYFEFKVVDEGIGMTQEEISNIFNRFYRVDQARAADIKGTGLGLSIVKWIVEAHNGQIFVESKPNLGSTFILMIPKSNN